MSTKERAFDAHTFTVALTQREVNIPRLAREANTSERYLRCIASGMVPGADVRHRVAEALAVAEDQLWPRRA